VTIAPRGAITSLKDKGRGNRQFARNVGGHYINDLGSSSGSLAVENAGPVSTTLRATADSPLAHVTRITLFRDGINRIEIQNDINQNFDATHTWRFGFELTSPDVWHEEVGAVIRAKLLTQGGHYSARTGNSRYDWLTLNHFADMSSDGVGVTLSNADCFFMKLGASTVSNLDTSTPQISALAGGRVANGNNGLPNQGGDSHFLQRFALQTHGGFDAVEAMKSALAHQNPLVTGEVTGGSAYPETAYSLVTISDPRVLLWALKPPEDGLDQGIVVRLWNLAPVSTILWLGLANGPIGQAWHLSHVETPIAAAPVTTGELVAELAGNQIKTYSLLPSGSDWQVLSAPTGVSASGGTYAYWVRVAWDAVEGATGYEVWRNKSNDLASAELLAPSVHGTVYGDTSCAPEQICYYWVRAKNAYSTSGFSVPDSGWKRLPLPTDTLILLPIITK
jgi:alpha-mannosidase